MSELVGDHLRGNVVAYLALFFALTGSATALSRSDSQGRAGDAEATAAVAKRSIDNRDLATGAVDDRVIKSLGISRNNLGRGIVNGAKVENRSLDGRDLAPGSIPGRKIDQRSFDRSIVQFRVSGSCPEGSAIRRIHEDGTSTCEPTGAGTLTGVTTSGGLTGGGDSGVVDVGVDPSVLQSRIERPCAADRAVAKVKQDGSVDCVPAVGEVTVSGGLTGGGGPGAVAIGTDPAALQTRVDDTCPAGEAVESVNEDGTVNCVAVGTGTVTQVDAGTGLTGGPITGSGTISADTSVLQRRVTGSCPSGRAIEGIGADGTVSCSTDLQPAGAVLTPDVTQIAVGTTRTLLQSSHISLVLDCTTPGSAEMKVTTSAAGGANVVADSNSLGLVGGTLGPSSDFTVASTASADRGDFNAAAFSPRATLAGSYFVARTSSGQCQSQASGLSS